MRACECAFRYGSLVISDPEVHSLRRSEVMNNMPTSREQVDKINLGHKNRLTCVHVHFGGKKVLHNFSAQVIEQCHSYYDCIHSLNWENFSQLRILVTLVWMVQIQVHSKACNELINLVCLHVAIQILHTLVRPYVINMVCLAIQILHAL